MTDDVRRQTDTLGTLGAADGVGVVRLQATLDTTPAELWSALTEPARLAHWLGEVSGELREGGEFRGHWLASGWEGTCRVEVCRPATRLLLRTASADEPDGVVEVTLTAEGERTVLVIEDRGLPVGHLAAYGAGDQIHLEDLIAYLAGRGRCEPRARWQELHAAYLELAPEDVGL